jgi:hypothetical protein
MKADWEPFGAPEADALPWQHAVSGLEANLLQLAMDLAGMDLEQLRAKDAELQAALEEERARNPWVNLLEPYLEYPVGPPDIESFPRQVWFPRLLEHLSIPR